MLVLITYSKGAPFYNALATVISADRETFSKMIEAKGGTCHAVSVRDRPTSCQHFTHAHQLRSAGTLPASEHRTGR